MATNRDKITNEKLATFIFDGTHKHCDYCILKGQCYSGRCESRGTCINNIVSWLEKETDKRCDNCKFHKDAKPFSLIGKKCVNPKSKECGAYTMRDCSCDKWEAKETQKEDKNKTIFIQLPKDEITSKAIETLLLELHKMSARLDKLEKCNRIAEVKEHIEESIKENTKDLMKSMRPITPEDAEEMIDKIGRCAEEVRQMNKTADEMFEELGYKIDRMISPQQIIYKNNYEDRIIINAVGYGKKNLALNFKTIDIITEAEDKAIHKKISELKEGLKDEKDNNCL